MPPLHAAVMDPTTHENMSQTAPAPQIRLRALFHTLFPAPSDKRVLLLCLFTNVLSVMTYVIVAPCLGNVIDVISASPKSTYVQLAKAVGMLAFAYVLSNTTLAAQVQLASSVGERLAKSVRGRLFYGLMMDEGASTREEGDDGGGRSSGSKLSWLTNDIGVLQTTVRRVFVTFERVKFEFRR
jgi:hypothetical protein